MSTAGENRTSSEELSDEALVALAARESSDGPAFSQLVQRHRERVWRICYRLLGNDHDAQDAAQEVFVRLFVNLSKFEGRSRFTTWLHGIALRTSLSLRRSRTRRRLRETKASEAQPDAMDARSATACPLSPEVRELLDELSEEDRAMVILKYAEGYTFEELAEMFEMTTSACKMRVSRARERLRLRHGESDAGRTST